MSYNSPMNPLVIKTVKKLSIPLLIGGVVLGAIGYLNLPDKMNWVFFLIYAGLSAFHLAVGIFKEKKGADFFYAQEIQEIFPSDTCENRMKFFSDEHGNRCVTLLLVNEPVPRSIKLMEGGYPAPFFTYTVQGKILTFKNSAYTSCEDYKPGVPIYSVRYYPRE